MAGLDAGRQSRKVVIFVRDRRDRKSSLVTLFYIQNSTPKASKLHPCNVGDVGSRRELVSHVGGIKRRETHYAGLAMSQDIQYLIRLEYSHYMGPPKKK